MYFYKIELFGHIMYSPDLSYDDLMAREEAAKVAVQTTLENAGGEFIHFEALDDALRFQCVLAEERDAVFHEICDRLAPHVKNGLDARLLLVDKDLDTLYYYSITNGGWQEAAVGLPPSGYVAPTPRVQITRPSTDHPKSRKR